VFEFYIIFSTLPEQYGFLLKQVVSISLLLLWIFFHYIRIEGYLQCPSNPLSSTPIFRCDCEKQTAVSVPDNGRSGTERAFSRQRVEDVFEKDILFALGRQEAVLTGSFSSLLLSPVPAGHHPAIFQPPRAATLS